MKKLALALACLVSVAFFASCDKPVENPEPSIAILNEEGYVQNNDVVDLNTEVKFGFVVSSNSQTQKALQSLVVKIDDVVWANLTDSLTGLTTYTYKDVVEYKLERDSIIGASVITATVTDEAGQMNTATINLKLNQPAHPLMARTFEWYRLGNTQTGLEEFGLNWEKNIKDTHAQIKPLDGVKLFIFNPSDWGTVATDLDKAALFNKAIENNSSVEVYNNVSTTAGGTYDDVIGTVKEDGSCYLIHVTKCVIGDFQSQGYPITISGETK